MVNGLDKIYVFLVSKHFTTQDSIHPFTNIDTLVADVIVQGATCSSGAITSHGANQLHQEQCRWGSASCPRMLRATMSV